MMLFWKQKAIFLSEFQQMLTLEIVNAVLPSFYVLPKNVYVLHKNEFFTQQS